MGFIVTEEMGLEVYGKWEWLGSSLKHGWVAALQSFVDRHNLCPVVDDVPGLTVEATPTEPAGVFRHAKGAFLLSDVREWSTSPAPDHGCGISVSLQHRPILGLDGDDAARFIAIFSRWEVK